MAEPRTSFRPGAAVAAIVAAVGGMLAAGGTAGASTAARKTVTAVTGNAYGYYTNVSLFGGPYSPRGPAPTVTLPAGGSATAITASVPSADAVYGPAHILTSGKETVSTKGTLGATGSVTTSTSIAGCRVAVPNSCNAGQIYVGPFTATSASSTCKATSATVTGSATIAGGQVVTKTDSNGNPVTTVNIPSTPPANYTVTGTIDTTGINGGFKWVFNEQTRNPDGSLTVNGGHEYLGFTGSGPAKGDAIFGQVTCGVK